MIRRFIPTRRFTMWCFVVLTGLLVVAWIVSLFAETGAWIADTGTKSHAAAYLQYGNLVISGSSGLGVVSSGFHFEPNRIRAWFDVLGSFKFTSMEYTQVAVAAFVLQIPLPWLFLSTALAAYVVRTEFRFSLKFLLIVVTLAALLIAWYAVWQLSLRLPKGDDPLFQTFVE